MPAEKQVMKQSSDGQRIKFPVNKIKRNSKIPQKPYLGKFQKAYFY